MSEPDSLWVPFIAILIAAVVITESCDSRAQLPAELGDNEICNGPSNVGIDC